MKNNNEKNTGFIRFYMQIFFKTESMKYLKMIAFLTLIFTVASIFAVINNINEINQKKFLRNCDFQSIEILNGTSDTAIPCYKASVFTSESDGGDYVEFNMFTSDDIPFFCEKNRIKGNFSEREGTVWLTFDSAYSLNASIGSKFFITIKNETNGGVIEIGEYTVDGILRPFCGELSSNTYDDDCGFACVFLNNSVDVAGVEGLNEMYLIFSDGTGNSDGNALDKYSFLSQSKLNADYIGKKVMYIFLFFSFIIVTVLALLEFMHYYSRRKKRFAILNALGLSEIKIHEINVLVFGLSSFTASIISIALHRLIMMEWIGKYVPWNVSIICSVFEFAVSIAAVFIYIFTLRKVRLTEVLFNDRDNRKYL